MEPETAGERGGKGHINTKRMFQHHSTLQYMSVEEVLSYS